MIRHLTLLLASTAALAQPCPDKSLNYWQAFPPGGESDLSARHQQKALKSLCPAIDAHIQYKPGAGGALLWSQMNSMPGDGTNIMGVNLPHMVLQPLAGSVNYKLDDITPVYWYHYTPDALVVPEASPLKSFADFLAQANKLNLAGAGLSSSNHLAQARLNREFGVSTTYIPYKGTGDILVALLSGQVDGAMGYSALAINNKGKVRALAIAATSRHPLLPDVPTFKELGVDWVDGAYRGIGVPKSTPPQARKKLSDLWAVLNSGAEMKELAARSGFELVDIGIEQMDAFMRERTRAYTEAAKRLAPTH